MAFAALTAALLNGCTSEARDGEVVIEQDSGLPVGIERADQISALDRAIARADSVEQLLLPLPLMTPAQEAALQTASNAQQLERARALAVRVTDTVTMRRLVGEGRLIALEAETAQWTTRKLTASLPYVVPPTRALLAEIGTRFQRRLGELGLPSFRVEVTSVLRTPESQAQLRETNANAAAGTSTHEFGSTLDIAYSGYAAPRTTEGGDPFEQRVTALALERMSARYSRELQAVLGEVLRQMQTEGLVMVTLERQQPVFHLTVGRVLLGGR